MPKTSKVILSNDEYGHAAFTLHADEILREVITDCKVSEAFDFNANPGVKHPQMIDAKALWDTGATNSAITKKLINQLGIFSFTDAQVLHSDGKATKDVYKVNILLPHGVNLPLLNVTEFSSISGNFDLLIGMDVITKGDFALTHQEGKTVVSFRTPSSCSIDFNDKETIVLSVKNNIFIKLKKIMLRLFESFPSNN